MIYRFDDIEIDTERFELRRGGSPQKVEPQVFALLELLVSNPRRVVSKDELNLRIWGGRVVSEAVVNSRIRSARQVIGDDGHSQRLIRTVYKRGFRFLGMPQVEDGAHTSIAPVPPVAGPADESPTADPADGRPSIAVLPFQMLGDDPRYAIVADGIAHEIIVELSRLHWLFVIARGSSFRFRGPEVDLARAGGILGARYFLSGSVAIHASRSVVTVELARAADSGIVWADRLEGTVDDLLGLRVTVATRIVTALELRIPMLEADRASRLPTGDLDAWSAYHRGLWHMYRFNAHDNAVAAQLFARALGADPGFARAHAGLSFTHFQNAFVGYSRDPGIDRRLAREHADRSMTLDPVDPFANLTMGRAIMLQGNLEDARPWFDRSVELNANFAFAIYNRALVDAVAGAAADSEAGAAKAMALSPIDPMRYAMLATRALADIVRQDYAAAARWGQEAALSPNAHVHVRVIAGISHWLAGDRAAAERWAAEVRRSDWTYAQTRFFAAFPFRDAAVRAQVETALDRLGL